MVDRIDTIVIELVLVDMAGKIGMFPAVRLVAQLQLDFVWLRNTSMKVDMGLVLVLEQVQVFDMVDMELVLLLLGVLKMQLDKVDKVDMGLLGLVLLVDMKLVALLVGLVLRIDKALVDKVQLGKEPLGKEPVDKVQLGKELTDKEKHKVVVLGMVVRTQLERLVDNKMNCCTDFCWPCWPQSWLRVTFCLL
jgi:hypothetical protein